MTEVLFYHLQGQNAGRRADAADGEVARSAAGGWWRRSASEERIEALDAHLWTYRDDGFLPHGTWREAGSGGSSRCCCTVNDTNPNAADGAVP